MDWENHLEKNSIPKIEKTVKIEVKLPHVNKKSLAACEQEITAACEQKITSKKSLVFSLHFLFRRDQNHYSNLISKS